MLEQKQFKKRAYIHIIPCSDFLIQNSFQNNLLLFIKIKAYIFLLLQPHL